MKLLAKMLFLVAEKFKDVQDKQGMPYLLHCIVVMQTCGLTDENSLCIAAGHDLIEDTDITYEYLTKEFNHEIALGIFLLSKPADLEYEEYIHTLGGKQIHYSIRKIKIADLKHNSDITRLKDVRDKDVERMIKYQKAYRYLMSIKN